MATLSFVSAERVVGPQPRALASRVFVAAKKYIDRYRERIGRVDWEEALFGLDNRDPTKRVWALKVVAELGDKDFLYKVDELREDKDAEVRRVACEVYKKLEACAEC